MAVSLEISRIISSFKHKSVCLQHDPPQTWHTVNPCKAQQSRPDLRTGHQWQTRGTRKPLSPQNTCRPSHGPDDLLPRTKENLGSVEERKHGRRPPAAARGWRRPRHPPYTSCESGNWEAAPTPPPPPGTPPAWEA
mmetsp:Transcript_19638/g.29725  ORF Transcript_19638/g.29725 Transcript_19638/m.29725 type:complete len:136 (-) Transcript_19638:185-592(-)